MSDCPETIKINVAETIEKLNGIVANIDTVTAAAIAANKEAIGAKLEVEFSSVDGVSTGAKASDVEIQDVRHLAPLKAQAKEFVNLYSLSADPIVPLYQSDAESLARLLNTEIAAKTRKATARASVG